MRIGNPEISGSYLNPLVKPQIYLDLIRRAFQKIGALVSAHRFSRPRLDLVSLCLSGRMGNFPDRIQHTKKGENQREQDGADNFMDPPPDLLETPLAAFVKGDHSRHHDLQTIAEGCRNRLWGSTAASSAHGWNLSASGSVCGDTPLPRRPHAAIVGRSQT